MDGDYHDVYANQDYDDGQYYNDYNDDHKHHYHNDDDDENLWKSSVWKQKLYQPKHPKYPFMAPPRLCLKLVFIVSDSIYPTHTHQNMVFKTNQIWAKMAEENMLV